MTKLQSCKVAKLSCSQQGTTLIEVLVYGVVFALFLLLITQVFLTIRTTTANSFVMVNLQQNLTRTFVDLNRTIRAAENVVTPSSGGSSTTLSLNNGSIAYQVDAGVLERLEDGTSIELSDNGASISAIVFENIGEATQAASIRIQMTIDSNYILEGGRRMTQDFQTTIGLR